MSDIMKNLDIDYHFYGVSPHLQTNPAHVFALLGVLHSHSEDYLVYLSHINVDLPHAPNFQNAQTIKLTAIICDKQFMPIETLIFRGVPAQCYESVSREFAKFLTKYNDRVYCEKQKPFSIPE